MGKDSSLTGGLMEGPWLCLIKNESICYHNALKSIIRRVEDKNSETSDKKISLIGNLSPDKRRMNII